MAVGAVAAVAWIVTGGSLIVALGLYALVGTSFILLAAVAAYFLSGLRVTEETPAPDPLHAAERGCPRNRVLDIGAPMTHLHGDAALPREHAGPRVATSFEEIQFPITQGS